MDDNWSSSAVERSVWQVDVGQHYDQQHEKCQAAENNQSRLFHVPLRHGCLVLQEAVAGVNHPKVA